MLRRFLPLIACMTVGSFIGSAMLARQMTSAPFKANALAEFEALGARILTAEEKGRIEDLLFGARAFTEASASAKLNPTIVGHSAADIARQAGIEVPDETPILLAECSEVSYSEPLTREKLSPVLAVLTAGTDLCDPAEVARLEAMLRTAEE